MLPRPRKVEVTEQTLFNHEVKFKLFGRVFHFKFCITKPR
ncbi:hypothetical protein [Synechococcus phage S-B68]|nr:hypothetical protein [Synechococcus phage S-B68]